MRVFPAYFLLIFANTGCGYVENEYDFIRASVIYFVDLTEYNIDVPDVEEVVHDFVSEFPGSEEHIEDIEVILQDVVQWRGKEYGGLYYDEDHRAYVDANEGCLPATAFYHELNHARLFKSTGDPDGSHSGDSWKQVRLLMEKNSIEKCGVYSVIIQ